MNALKILFKTQRVFEYKACDFELGHLKCKITGYQEASTKIENGTTYHYPETIEVKFENWSNWFFSFRLQDGRWIPEGSDLNGKGLSTFKLMRNMIREMKAYAEAIKPKPILVLKAKNKKDAERIAIHLLKPTKTELERAMYQAERDGFETIVIHTDKTWPKAGAQ